MNALLRCTVRNCENYVDEKGWYCSEHAKLYSQNIANRPNVPKHRRQRAGFIRMKPDASNK